MWSRAGDLRDRPAQQWSAVKAAVPVAHLLQPRRAAAAADPGSAGTGIPATGEQGSACADGPGSAGSEVDKTAAREERWLRDGLLDG